MYRATIFAVCLATILGSVGPVSAQLGSPVRVEEFGFVFRPPAGWQSVRIGAGTGEVKHYKHPQELGRVVVAAFAAPSLDFGRYLAMEGLRDMLRGLGASVTTKAAARPCEVGGREAVRDELSIRVTQLPVPIVGEAVFVRSGAHVLMFLGVWAEKIGPAAAVQQSVRSVSFLASADAGETRVETAQGATLRVPNSWRVGPDERDPAATAIRPPSDAEAELAGLRLLRVTWDVLAEVGVTHDAYRADGPATLDRICETIKADLLKEVERDLAEHKAKRPNDPVVNSLGAAAQLERVDLVQGTAVGRLTHYQVPVRYSLLDTEVKLRLMAAALTEGEAVWLVAGWCPEEWTDPHLSALVGVITSLAPEGAPEAAGPEPATPAKPDAETMAQVERHCAAAAEHKKAKRYGEALRELKAGLKLWPDCAEAHWLAAWCCIGAGDKTGAGAHFRRVIELQPNTDRAREAQRAIDSIRAQARAPTLKGPIAGRTVRYVVIPGGGIYHSPTCKIVKAAPPGTTRPCCSVQEARRAGALTPCSMCKPGPLAAVGDPANTRRELERAIRCRGTTQEGVRCHNMTRNPSGYCHYHRDQAPKPHRP